MTFDIQAMLDLWSQPDPLPSEAAAAFRAVYTEPVLINGVPLSAHDLAERARGLQQSFEDVHREVIEICDAGTKLAVAFRLEGRHVGPLATSAGMLQPTGQWLSLRVIDVLTVADGKVSAVTMVADELAALAAVNAAALLD